MYDTVQSLNFQLGLRHRVLNGLARTSSGASQVLRSGSGLSRQYLCHTTLYIGCCCLFAALRLSDLRALCHSRPIYNAPWAHAIHGATQNAIKLQCSSDAMPHHFSFSSKIVPGGSRLHLSQVSQHAHTSSTSWAGAVAMHAYSVTMHICTGCPLDSDAT